ncbi:Putative transposase, YhgA-like [Butyrivibrio sp. INlla18]|uniref:Rpn family recombination-promoting nuclease/putative transposase n=1 Tax=Butyrivibrio sp. INlla18 TaxID=1520806 RepID=UPI0008841B5E|nr:Rpn family recombination-promoting nuclease/putative transposase [Butyrivibrio sp. INlla18]SDA65857.1 Putative transposase, YhgA-like [Butyrivibrio sp. INlla18]
MKKSKQISNSKTADSGGKIIFENPVLCSQLFNDYVDMEELKKIKPEDIEDVTERFIPMFTEQRDADVIKKVHLAENKEIFIALIEHKSGVDYNVIMQILRYMVYIWEDYEQEQNKLIPGVSHTKDFKYPPILPIVYYEGKDEWTASKSLSERIVLNDAFGDYKNLKLPKGYLDGLFENSPEDVLKVIARVIAVILRKQNVPENDIQDLVDKIERRQHMGLFDDWEGFDVQEERRNGEEIKLIKQVSKKISLKQDAGKIAADLVEDEDHIKRIYDIAIKYAPDYDPEKIYNELISKNKAIVKS